MNTNFCPHTLLWWERMVRFQGRAPLVLHREPGHCREAPELQTVPRVSQFTHFSLPKENSSMVRCMDVTDLTFSHACPFLWICQLKTCECEPVSAQGQCLLTSMLWRSESREIPPTGMYLTLHSCLPNQREELQSSICSKGNGWEWIEYRTMNIKILLFF